MVMNLQALGARVVLVGFCGNDGSASRLQGLLRRNGVSTEDLVHLAGYPTPLKSRVLSGGENTRKQQVLRIDYLPQTDIGKPGYRRLERLLLRLLSAVDGLVISDYLAQAARGSVYEALRRRFPRMFICADSRSNLLDFRKATVVTPNEPEIKALFSGKRFAGEADFLEAGAELRDRLQVQGVVLKRGHRGMLVFEKGRRCQRLSIYGTSQIVDETGAGDTVLAVISLGVLAGAGLTTAARLATIAGGLAVMKEGAAPVPASQLADALREIP